MKNKTPTLDDIEWTANDIAQRVVAIIKELNWPMSKEYRRDLDGVSSLEYLVQKMVGEILLEKNRNSMLAGLYEIEDYDPTPCCYQHGVGAIGTNEPCPAIADND